MKDYRVTVKVRNNRILKAIAEAGGEPGQKWCEANGLTYSTVNNLINMTSGPLLSSINGGGLSTTAQRLCDVLNKLPEDLWSNDQLYPLEKNFSELEMDGVEVAALIGGGEQSYLQDFSNVETEELKRDLGKAMQKLTFNERHVLAALYEDGMTLEAIGDRLDLSRERIRQIQLKAEAKLRNQANVLKEHIQPCT